ncbi:inverse autotransporter beta domain-containing protein [Pantoea sp. C2G6]
MAFTPAIAATSEQHFLQHPAAVSTPRTQVYTLKEHETAASVAAKYGLTLAQLSELNQFRTFARGLNGLRPGDDVDVPVVMPEGKKSSLPPFFVDASGNAGDEHPQSAGRGEDDEQARKMAGYASQTGSFLSGSAKSDAAASRARGMATNEAGGALQQWLSHFGTARVQLDADKNFSLKNSQFDLLMPLYDQGDDLLFTQGSLHRTDGRTQANLGSGLRYFTSTYMFGGNLFGDYDLSRDHARAGAGLEYWRDYLKLGLNGYRRLTGWKDSPGLTDYQERPANGWDLRAQAWVPALPQLGARLTYEQYYGKEVALFGVDHRQRDPHAITAGLSYTPVPLITLAGEQRQGQSGQSDTRVMVNMNYQLGVPWRSQMDPAAVAAMRSLTGSRYDLVERNNNIVLEYRRKEVIKLHTVDLITGKAGEQKSLGVSVTTTYGLSRIDWDAAALTAAGGRIVQNGADYAVLLPAYQASAQAVNTYSVSGVAVDIRGNHSDRSDTQVTVQAPEVNKQYSTFTPASSVLQADGKGTQILTLTLRDENNQLVDVETQEISLRSNSLKSALVSTLTRKSAGVYSVTVTAGTDVENVTLTPVVSGITLSSAVVTINSTTPDAGQSVFTASPERIVADNSATSTLTLMAKDAQGNILTGLKDNLTFLVTDNSGKAPASGVITESAITESSVKGTYTATLKGTTAAQYKVIPQFNGTALGSLSAVVTLTPATPEQAASAIKVDNSSYLSGADMAITVTLKDAQGNAVIGAASLLTAEAVSVPDAVLKSGSGWSDNGDGTYTATYTASTAGTGLKAVLKLSGWSANAESAAYTITAASPDQAKSAIAVDNSTYASGTDITVTVTLKDAQDNAVIGASSLLTTGAVTVANAVLKSGSNWSDNGDGTYMATYTASTAGTGLKALLKLSGWSANAESAAYTITAATPDQAKSAIAVDSSTYASGADITVTVTLKDAQDNAVTGASSQLTASAVTVPNAVPKSGSGWSDNGDGTYTATYTASTAGTGLKAVLKLSGWSGSNTSASYDILQETEAPLSINTQADSHTFTISSEEGTFPSTGFVGATFTIIPKNNIDASEYNWSANLSWVAVTDGVVQFTGTGNGDKVVITGAPKNAQNKTIRYAFSLKNWFINDQSVQMTWAQANAYCSGQSGYSLPTVAQLSQNSGYVATQVRGTGALWNEWGNVTHYSGAGFFGSNYWSSEPDSSGGHYYIDLGAGYIHNDVGSVTDIVTCSRDL